MVPSVAFDDADHRNGVEQPVIEIRKISKTFGAKTVLSDVSLAIKSGEIRALLGQNGSGKSTLIKILSGYHDPDPGGEVSLAGEPLAFGSPTASHRLGLRFVHQDLGLILTMSVADNISFASGFDATFGKVRTRASRKRARAVLDKFGLEDIDPDVNVLELTQAQRTGVAIARALDQQNGEPPSVLILDEPTASLPAEEVQALLAILRRTAEAGVAIIYVSHHLEEVFQVADSISVLRDGTLISTSAVDEVSREEVITALIGSDLAQDYREGAPVPARRGDDVCLEVRGLESTTLRGISFDVHAGEILGIYGLTGSGRDAILGSIFGVTTRLAGTVRAGGQAVNSGDPLSAIRAKIGYLPADRRALGGMPLLTARENLTLLTLGRHFRRWTMSRSSELADANRWFEELEVRPSDGQEMPWGSFSGGNQQKIVLAKWLQMTPRVLLMDDPTQGVDIGAKVAIHRQVRDLAASGTGVVLASTDETELAALCGRVLVIQRGHVIDEILGDRLTASSITRSMHTGSPSEREGGVHHAR